MNLSAASKKNETVVKTGVEKGGGDRKYSCTRTEAPSIDRLEPTLVRFYPNENPQSIKAPRFHRNTHNLRYVSGWAGETFLLGSIALLLFDSIRAFSIKFFHTN